jgi:predicted metal-dependent hydrolase
LANLMKTTYNNTTMIPEYNLTKKLSSRLTLKINDKGKILVNAPIFLPRFKINQFVSDNLTWIKIQQNRLERKEKLVDYQSQYLFILGKKYPFQITNNLNEKPNINLTENKLIINTFKNFDNKALKEKFLKNKLKIFLTKISYKYLNRKAEILAQKMDLSYKSLIVKNVKSKWGSCSNRKDLVFNLKLICFEPKTIDYVIIHELAHLKHLDHSRNFWRLVEKFEPNYKIYRNKLKNKLVDL